MSIFLFLFLAFLFYFIILPVIKGMLFVSKARNQMRDMFNQATGQTGSKKQKNSQPEAKKKKIDSTVGEYVDFEEIQVSETESETSAEGSKTYKTESQIDDVEWEEIS